MTRTGVPIVCYLYRAFVVAMVATYALFAMLPFVLSGAWVYSYSEIAAQTGVPGYALGAMGTLLVLLSGMAAPIIGFMPVLVWGPMLMRGELARPVARVLLPAMLAHGSFLVFVTTYGVTILTWILD